jgi:hypothetical protein
VGDRAINGDPAGVPAPRALAIIETGKNMRNPNLFTPLIIGTIIVALGGWHFGAIAAESNSTKDATTEATLVSVPLDGMTFTAAPGPDGKPKDVPDSLVFQNSSFVSKECELRCKYPARPCFVRVNGGKTEFISEAECPCKDAKIVWRGSVERDRIKGKSTWIVKRRYWTHKKTFEFGGKRAEKSSFAVNTEQYG